MKSVWVAIILGGLALPSLPSLPGDTDANRGTDEIRFNGYQGTWERARPTDELKMNPYSQEYQYKPQGYEYKFNPYTGKFE